MLSSPDLKRWSVWIDASTGSVVLKSGKSFILSHALSLGQRVQRRNSCTLQWLHILAVYTTPPVQEKYLIGHSQSTHPGVHNRGTNTRLSEGKGRTSAWIHQWLNRTAVLRSHGQKVLHSTAQGNTRSSCRNAADTMARQLHVGLGALGSCQ